MGISYGILGTALRPANTSEAEWIVVPTGHEYIGVVRICNQDSAAQTFRLAHNAATGASTGEDWDCYDTPIEAGETIDITMEMAAAETLRIKASKADVISFKFTGMDRANL